jgi:hypothetical protein
MSFVKINFTPDRIKYILYEEMKTIVFNNNGVIFGGFVRDMIISDHYKSIYNSENKYNIHKFWNRFCHPQTAARTIVANDMDICMYSEEDVDAFIIALRNAFNSRIGYTDITSSVISVSSENSYFHIPIILHKKINYTITIGKIPFVHRGIDISFDFDIIVPRNKKMMPPFNRVDMLSNVFILNRQGIVISNNTGTIIDNMSILNKQKISARIMEDIVEFKTQFCMKNYSDNYTCGCFKYNNKVYERLNKILSKDFKWNITNMPLTLGEHNKASNNGDTNCSICLSKFRNKEGVVKVFIDNSSKTDKVCSIAHDKCMLKYFKTQIENAKSDMISGGDDFKFRCPMRNIINFKLYADNIDEIIREKMKN